MKKIILLFVSLSLANLTKAQSWELNLNSNTNPDSKFGTSNPDPINFYTAGQRRMVLDADGNLIIDRFVASSDRFLQTDKDGVLIPWIGSITNCSKVLFGDNVWRTLPISVVAATGSQPNIVYLGASTGKLWVPPCNYGWNPTSSQIGLDIFQIQRTSGGTSVLNMGLTTLGDAVISVEAVTPPGTQKLKFNPSCNNDVELCQGGGLTKIYYGASVGTTLRVGPGTFASTNSQFDMLLDAAMTKAITIVDPALTTTNKNILQVSRAGEMVLGKNVSGAAGSMLTIGQPVWSSLALSLTDNSVSPDVPFFNVRGDGLTEIIGAGNQAFSIKSRYSSNVETFAISTNGYTQIKTANTKALSVYNASNSNNETFSVEKNGYTEIKVYSPTGMPTPYSAGKRALTVRDMTNNKDIFVVNSNGKVFAREVEISLSTNFPDYVFAKDYKLKSISEVEKYIAENKHLPGFEKGEYYEKNGLNVNEMFLKQQEKIEELTLYIIELKNRLQAVENK